MPILSQVYVHPVKSMRGLRLSHAQVTPAGLAFDRTFMITDLEGTFITARQYPHMLCFTPALLSHGISLTAPDGENRVLSYDEFSPAGQPTEVWGNHFTALIAPEDINSWLSRYFKRSVQLRWVGTELTRRVKRHPEIPLSFADGYPFLLINESSFQNLQQRCSAKIQIEQFRPNFIVQGFDAFIEDTWQVIRIGDVIFDAVKPCSRCILTTVDIVKGQKHPQGEPLHTLQQFRTARNGDVDFGLNLIARHSGIIRANDEVEILSTKPPRSYLKTTPTDSVEISKSEWQAITINYAGQSFIGNNQEILLEQLEQQGIRIPYSCRAGVCGTCRLKLENGNVSPLKRSAIQDDNMILSCSCIPKSDITLA